MTVMMLSYSKLTCEVLKISSNITKDWTEIVSYFICGSSLTHLTIYTLRTPFDSIQPAAVKAIEAPILWDGSHFYIHRLRNSLIK